MIAEGRTRCAGSLDARRLGSGHDMAAISGVDLVVKISRVLRAGSAALRAQ
jgi:hypothetical protein